MTRSHGWSSSLADDTAARHHDRTMLAAALVTVANGWAPAMAMAMGAGGGTAVVRARRLLAPHALLSRAARLTGGFGVASFLALPVALAANSAFIALLEWHCHLPL